MKLGLTYWKNRISPVFYASNILLIVDIENGKIKNRRYEYFNPMATFSLASTLNNFGIEVLICGAILERTLIIFEYRELS